MSNPNTNSNLKPNTYQYGRRENELECKTVTIWKMGWIRRPQG